MPPRTKSKPDAPAAAARPPKKPRGHGSYTSFYWQGTDVHALERVRTLLGFKVDTQVARLALRFLHATVERCASVAEAEALLGDVLREVRAVKTGRKPRAAAESQGAAA